MYVFNLLLSITFILLILKYLYQQHCFNGQLLDSSDTKTDKDFDNRKMSRCCNSTMIILYSINYIHELTLLLQ